MADLANSSIQRTYVRTPEEKLWKAVLSQGGTRHAVKNTMLCL